MTDALARFSPDQTDAQSTLHTYFDMIAGEHPSALALSSPTGSATYGELRLASNRIANAILQAGGKPSDRVALLMTHDSPLIAAALAILRAGRIPVVLNPTDPPERLKHFLDDADSGLILADPRHRDAAHHLANDRRHVLALDASTANESERDPAIPVRPDDLAFLVYTSASTGRPKAVMQTHRNILRNAFRLSRGMELRATDRVALLASLSGGQGLATTWCALSSGASLHPFPIMEKGVTGLARWTNDAAISVMVAASSLFRNFARTLDPDATFPGVRLLRLGSEPSTAGDLDLFRRLFPESCTFFHTYSSSETGNITQLHLNCTSQMPEGRLPVGRVATDMEIRLLDDQGREVPPGDVGTISVRSRYLSPGYWRNEALTRERFSEAHGPGDIREFHSGDTGRFLDDGMLLLTGRRDSMVKVRGFRIELSEIENALSALAPVERAAICLRARAAGEPEIAAFVVPRPGHACTGAILRTALRRVLPEHMVPSSFALVDTLPITPHGKVDRQALALLAAPESQPTEIEPARTPTEELLADAWTNAMGRSPIGRNANFFDLGGDSLVAAIVSARIHAAYGVELHLRAFADHPTLADLAETIDGLRSTSSGDKTPPLTRSPRDAPLPLSFIQERTWRLSRTESGSASFTGSASYRILGRLDVDVFRECMDFLAARHDILRTTYIEQDGRPVQIIQPPGPAALEFIDLSAEPDVERYASALEVRLSRRVFDLSRGPLQMFWLLRVRRDEHWLLRVGHHILCDGWSWDVFFRELGLLYEAKIHNEDPPLPQGEPLQYADYAAWQRATFHPGDPAYEESLVWWMRHYSGKSRRGRIPFARPEPIAAGDPAEGVVRWGVEPAISRQLDAIAADSNATYFIVRLATFAAFMLGETAGENIAIRTHVTGRNRLELQTMFGFFANRITLRFSAAPQSTFRQWVGAVRDTVIQAQAHSDIPYDQLCAALQARGIKPPAAKFMFGISNHHYPRRFAGLDFIWRDRHAAFMPWGFNVRFDPKDEEHNCRTTFDTRLYDPPSVRAAMNRYTRFVENASRFPDEPLDQILLLSGVSRPIPDGSKTARGKGGPTLARMVRRMAELARRAIRKIVPRA